MATTYPTALDNFTNPATLDVVDITRIGNAFDAIEALQAKVGTNSSAVTSSLDFKVATNTATIAGHIAATVVHGATGAVVGTTNVQTLTNKTFSDIINAPAGIAAKVTNGKLLADIPSSYPAGFSTASVLAANGWPDGGIVMTNVQETGTYATQILFSRTSATAYMRSSTSAASWTQAFVPIQGATPFAQVAVDQGVSSSTVVNANNTLVTLAAGRTYLVKAFLAFTGAQAGDARVRWVTTGAPTNLGGRLCFGPSINTTDATGTAAAAITVGPARMSRATITTEVTYGTDATNESAVYEEMLMQPSAAATMQVMIGQGTTNGTNTVLKAGSYVIAHQVA